jgi:peptide/nickel transport system substrate-binding protein
MRRFALFVVLSLVLPLSSVRAEEKILRIAMTASDIPTTTGMPNNGFEGMRFLGFPVFEGLIAFDLTQKDQPVVLKPGLAEKWEQAADDKKTWIFHLRHGVKFHDGTEFNADAVIWNLERIFNKDSAQFEANATGIMRARMPILASYKKIDDYTVAISTTIVASFFQWMMPYMLMASPTAWEKAGKDWGKVQFAPAGTGPFKIAKFVPHQSVTLAKNVDYWDAKRMAKVDQVILLPIPEANTRLAALRSGQVDWIEVPPPDGIPSLKQAGFVISTGSYPHDWPWLFNMAAKDSPFKDVRVRQALNYCIDRSAIIGLLNGTAEPSVGWLKPGDPAFGKPENHYTFDPARGKKLLADAGYDDKKPLSFKVMISTSGSGQMLPLPMNEALQENLKQACNVDVKVDAVEWQVLLNVGRAEPDSPQLNGAMAINVSSPSSDAAAMYRYFAAANFSPKGFNFEHWTDDKFEEALAKLADATDDEVYLKYYAAAHERLVDNPPWLFIVHDLNPRAFSKKVRGFVSPQSWFVDLTLVDLQ